MKKTLYSLMLSEDVVREIDLLAHRTGTNRSSLINQILAEYVNLTTPEKRVNDIFKAIDDLMSSSALVPFFMPNTATMSLKSSLEYKYRPTVKYEVELYRNAADFLGEISVIFRTQSASLISEMTDFFRLWKAVEDRHLAPVLGSGAPRYALYEGKFVRTIALPRRSCTAEELAGAISDYIRFFDGAMKKYLSGREGGAGTETEYIDFLENGNLLI